MFTVSTRTRLGWGVVNLGISSLGQGRHTKGQTPGQNKLDPTNPPINLIFFKIKNVHSMVYLLNYGTMNLELQ